jgi:hypothetical protein
MLQKKTLLQNVELQIGTEPSFSGKKIINDNFSIF